MNRRVTFKSGQPLSGLLSKLGQVSCQEFSPANQVIVPFPGLVQCFISFLLEVMDFFKLLSGLGWWTVPLDKGFLRRSQESTISEDSLSTHLLAAPNLVSPLGSVVEGLTLNVQNEAENVLRHLEVLPHIGHYDEKGDRDHFLHAFEWAISVGS
ncbi:hypothetical protein Tco_0958862 [Tanacetum coccineum]